jgi:hypothetical protein
VTVQGGPDLICIIAGKPSVVSVLKAELGVRSEKE